MGCFYLMRYKTACESVRLNHFKATVTLSFRGSTNSTTYIATASLLTNKVMSTKQMYINVSDFGKYVKSGT